MKNWGLLIKTAQDNLEMAKSRTKSVYDGMFRDYLWTCRKSSNGAKSLVKIKAPEGNLVSNASKVAELENTPFTIDMLPDYYKYKTLHDELNKKLSALWREMNEPLRAVFYEKRDDYLRPYYSKRRELYDRYLQSPEWQQKRRDCIEHHGDACLDCGEMYQDIHHIHYETLGDECPANDIVPLCRRCHEMRHRLEDISL